MPCCDAGCFIGHLFGLKTGLGPAPQHKPSTLATAGKLTELAWVYIQKKTPLLTSTLDQSWKVVSTFQLQQGDTGSHPWPPEQHQPHRK